MLKTEILCGSFSWKSLKFIYSEKATKFDEIFTLLLTVCTVVKSKVKISQNFVALSEYMNFTYAIREIENVELLAKNTWWFGLFSILYYIFFFFYLYFYFLSLQ